MKITVFLIGVFAMFLSFNVNAQFDPIDDPGYAGTGPVLHFQKNPNAYDQPNSFKDNRYRTIWEDDNVRIKY